MPGLAVDDPAPDGAIVLRRLGDGAGRLYVGPLYRSQTLDQIRALTPPERRAPYAAVLQIAGCRTLKQDGVCSLAEFRAAPDR